MRRATVRVLQVFLNDPTELHDKQDVIKTSKVSEKIFYRVLDNLERKRWIKQFNDDLGERVIARVFRLNPQYADQAKSYVETWENCPLNRLKKFFSGER